MSKKILVTVMAVGCTSRFRNGMQFTQTEKEVLVNDSELAALEADNYLQVKVISEDTQALDAVAGANNENTDKHLVQGSVLSVDEQLPNHAQPDTIIHDNHGTAQLGSIPATHAVAGANTTTINATSTPDTVITDVSEKPDDHLTGVIDAMRKLNLDVAGDKPTVKQLKELGLDVSAAERDAAWDVLVAEHAERKA